MHPCLLICPHASTSSCTATCSQDDTQTGWHLGSRPLVGTGEGPCKAAQASVPHVPQGLGLNPKPCGSRQHCQSVKRLACAAP
jgi:hypothetical protein